MFWLGVVMMTAYYMDLLFRTSMGWLHLGQTTPILLLPVLIAFFLYLDFRKDRGRTKMTYLSIAVFFGLLHLIFFIVSGWTLGDIVWYGSWSIGAAIVMAGGAAMLSMTADYEAYTEGILDVKALHYGPPREEPSVEVGAAPAPKKEEEGEKAPVAPTETTE
jgi:hypothetical protein